MLERFGAGQMEDRCSAFRLKIVGRHYAAIAEPGSPVTSVTGMRVPTGGSMPGSCKLCARSRDVLSNGSIGAAIRTSSCDGEPVDEVFQGNGVSGGAGCRLLERI